MKELFEITFLDRWKVDFLGKHRNITWQSSKVCPVINWNQSTCGGVIVSGGGPRRQCRRQGSGWLGLTRVVFFQMSMKKGEGAKDIKSSRKRMVLGWSMKSGLSNKGKFRTVSVNSKQGKWIGEGLSR